MVSTLFLGTILIFGGIAAGIAYAIHRKRVEKRRRQAEREEYGLA